MEIKTLKTKDYGSGFSLVDTDLLNQFQADYKEAIEALVTVQLFAESVYNTEVSETRYRSIIEKAYGEKWEDIRSEK